MDMSTSEGSWSASDVAVESSKFFAVLSVLLTRSSSEPSPSSSSSSSSSSLSLSLPCQSSSSRLKCCFTPAKLLRSMLHCRLSACKR